MNSTQLTASDGAILAFIASYWLVLVIIAVLSIIAMWRIFSKAGRPGWVSLIPVYNNYALYKIAFGSAKEFWIVFFTGLVGGIAAGLSTSVFTSGAGFYACVAVGLIFLLAYLVYTIKFSFALAKSFGKGVGFGFGLLFLSPLFMLILGLGSAQYVRADSK